MKAHISKSAKFLFTACFTALLLTSHAAPKKQDPPMRKDHSNTVELTGKIVINTKEVGGSYKLEVLYRDAVVNTFRIKNNGEVRLLLKKDTPYMIKISKAGYIARYICVNTNLSNKTSRTTFAFHLETDLIAVADAMRLDDEALQLPIALISYDKNEGNFANNKDYSAFVQQRIFSGFAGMYPSDKKD